MQKLIELYQQWKGAEPANIQQLPGAGSNRSYFRLTDTEGQTVIGVIGTSRDEDHAFIYLTEHFNRRKLPVPKILAASDDQLRYIQTDLGSISLFDAIRGGREAGGRYTLKEQELLRRTIRELPNVQIRGARGLDFSNCYPQAEFDVDSVLFDLNYFKYCFLKATELDFHELKLEADFRLLAKDLTIDEGDRSQETGGFFLYRDFQARNVMLDAKGNPWFIDYQGGRKGPYYYDLASFLWQASAKYPHKLRRELVYEYYNSLKHYTEVPPVRHFVNRLSLFVLFRTLQVLGAYGFRGYFEQKKHFIESIPPAIQNLRELISDRTFHYPYLMDILRQLTELPQFARVEATAKRADGYKTTDLNPYKAHPQDGPATFSKYDAQGPLVVKVFSFSYRKGIPEDESGNGGGYVFDCRSTHNPGRYEPYKKLTGLDEPVIRFLEDDGEILTFLDSVYKLADAHVRRYIQRGFTSLMFSFGCTGGQHRSVYSAQHLAEHIHEKFGIEVRICHREQNIRQTIPARKAGVKQAMIFAAGLGTRLKPLTDTMPKALVKVGGQPLLWHVIMKLKSAGFERIVVNVHHFARQIVDYLDENNRFGLDIRISDESDGLLETGGGIKKALPLLDSESPVLIHNVDILSNADLAGLYALAERENADGLLLVSRRQTKRYLQFDNDMRLIGWKNVETGEVKGDEGLSLAFSGIHVLSPSAFRLFDEMPDRFGIMDFYLKYCHRQAFLGRELNDLQLLDVGKLDSLDLAEQFLQNHKS